METKQSSSTSESPQDNFPTDPYEIAFKWHSLGFHVLPSGGGGTGKEPISAWKEYQDRDHQPTDAQLEEWQNTLHPKVWCCVSGRSGIDFIDVETDSPESDHFMLGYGLKPHFQSPRGGHHYCCEHPPWEVKSRAPIRGLTKIDVRGDPGIVNFAGSVNGSSYKMLRWPTPENLIPFASLPLIVRRGLEPQPEPPKNKKDTHFPPLSAEDCQKCADNLETLPCIVYCRDYAADLPETQWWQMISQFVCFGQPGEEKIHKLSQGYQKHKGYSEHETQEKIDDTKKARQTKDIGPHLCQTIRDAGFRCPAECITQVEKMGVSTPATLAIKLTLARDRLPLNDMGNAIRFWRLFGGDIRFVLQMEKWLVWNGSYWQFDYGEQLGSMVKKTVSSIYAEAATEDDPAYQKNLAAWAKTSGNETKVNGLIAEARWCEGIPIMPDRLDANPWLLNVNNGTINLENGQLQPHLRDDLITRMIPTNYNPDAESQLWEDTLKQVFSGNSDLILYIQRALGYSITGVNQEMAVFFPQGNGFNGKSTVLNTVADVVGPYYQSVDPAVFMVSKHDRTGPNENIADLYRARYVLSSEIETEMKLSVGLVKRITGGEELRHERKYEHGFTFRPEFKIWLMGNHEPAISDTTNSIWGRIKKIPFTHFFKPEERISDLRQLLVRDHAEAILAWLVQGAIEWREFGLSEPEIVKKATAEYRESQDTLRDFLLEQCTIESSATVTVAEIYNAYIAWCAATSEKRPMGKITFGRALKERGLTTKQGGKNITIWYGIKLTQEG